jgi:hypothetical protein
LQYRYSSINAIVFERNMESEGRVYMRWLSGDAETGVARPALPDIMRVFSRFVKSIRLGGAFEPDVHQTCNCGTIVGRRRPAKGGPVATYVRLVRNHL